MPSSLISPRLNDYFDLSFTQDDVDFAIPYLSQDIPLFLDPFLLWTSSNALLNQLHDNLMEFFACVQALVTDNQESGAKTLLYGIMEPNELGLGYSVGSKRGSTIGEKLVSDIISMYRDIPEINKEGIDHIEEIQFVVPKISSDRISDITYCILKDFFIKYTTSRCEEHKIPTKEFIIPNVWDKEKKTWNPGVRARIPFNPLDGTPLILAPLSLLRHLHWINSKDYKASFFFRHVLPKDKIRERKLKVPNSEQIIQANRRMFSRVKTYVHMKEKAGDQCEADPFNDEVIIEGKLKEATRTLMHLEKQVARFGDSYVPPQIALDLEDQKAKVEKIESELLTVKREREKRLEKIHQLKEEAIQRGWDEILQRSSH